MARNGRFAFVDGLSGLFTGEAGPGKDRTLRSSGIDHVRSEIEAALGDVRTGTKILVVDQLDALLAASDEDVTSTSLSAMLLSLREVSISFPREYATTNNMHSQSVHSTVITLAADDPLLHTQTTTLEREHAALVLVQAHAAGRVLALRMLDTGTAKDVSGVVRITGQLENEGREYLYYVAGDGSVKVFERGT